ncbi:MAG TPA: phosphoribosylaminoimidazolesuccinocarboxamide synthase [Casimicrobiaceae bacterium]|nr:phosphoribosylaminoimidazolesuccinocarboxamide synthase [Casimicrobiaceae bacterium]
MATPLFRSDLQSLPLVHRGKVRDSYALGEKHLLIVVSDRLSAFDVVLPQPIPGKGAVLTALTDFWMTRFEAEIPNHRANEIDLGKFVTPDELAVCVGRSVVAKRLTPLTIEAVARGYLIGSGFKEYRQAGSVSGIALPVGLRMADKLPEPLFTPANKAPAGEHDENIDYAEVERRVGHDVAAQVRDVTLRLYRDAAAYALERGVIIADTKFEFGLDEAGTLHLIDEVLTPDSSRFWALDTYRPGESPPSFDKQIVRDYLETLDWNKASPAPSLPDAIVRRTADRYREAQRLLTGVRDSASTASCSDRDR